MTGTFAMLPLSSIRPHRRNPRRKIATLTEMVDSIRAMGLLKPVLPA